jgi:hypothetical protein
VSDASKTKPVKPLDPLERIKKIWKRTAPLRKVLAWIFVLHGTIRLATDFWNLREPFIGVDLRTWWRWAQVQWAHVRGVKVKVSS